MSETDDATENLKFDIKTGKASINEPYGDRVKSYLRPKLLAPAEFIRSKWVQWQRDDPTNVYYHRQYRRVPTVDQCYIGDGACFFEAEKQFQRDKRVDRKICHLLNMKHQNCHEFHKHDAETHCYDIDQAKMLAERNYFIKYGDLGISGQCREAFIKQQHRMIWERRHGRVGDGMKKEEPPFVPFKPRAFQGTIFGFKEGPVPLPKIFYWYNLMNDHSMRIKDGDDHPSSYPLDCFETI